MSLRELLPSASKLTASKALAVVAALDGSVRTSTPSGRDSGLSVKAVVVLARLRDHLWTIYDISSIQVKSRITKRT